MDWRLQSTEQYSVALTTLIATVINVDVNMQILDLTKQLLAINRENLEIQRRILSETSRETDGQTL